MFDFRNQKLLVVSPHPDDEVLGCAGLMQKVKDSDGQVFVLFLTVGDTNDFSQAGFSSSTERQEEIKDVAQLLRFDDYHLAFEGNEHHLRLDTVGQKRLMDLIERGTPLSLERIKPTMVAFPSLASYNQDHRMAALATHAALRPANGPKHLVSTVLTYEELGDGWTLQKQPEVNFFVPLNRQELATKLSAMSLYRSQVRPAPHLRSLEMIKAFAQLRGAQSGASYAESFTLHRTIYQTREGSSTLAKIEAPRALEASGKAA